MFLHLAWSVHKFLTFSLFDHIRLANTIFFLNFIHKHLSTSNMTLRLCYLLLLAFCLVFKVALHLGFVLWVELLCFVVFSCLGVSSLKSLGCVFGYFNTCTYLSKKIWNDQRALDWLCPFWTFLIWFKPCLVPKCLLRRILRNGMAWAMTWMEQLDMTIFILAQILKACIVKERHATRLHEQLICLHESSVPLVKLVILGV